MSPDGPVNRGPNRRALVSAAGFSLRSGQQGVALLAALILMLAVVLTLGNIFYRHQMDIGRATGVFHSDQASLIALSTENWARGLLSSENDDRETDNLQEPWAMAVPLLPVDGGYISGCLMDMQSRLNINSLAAYDGERLNNEINGGIPGLATVWRRLMQNLQLASEPVHVAAIVDWIDADNEPVNQWGGEQGQYDFDRLDLLVANAPLTDAAELSVVRGYTPLFYQMMAPYISALPEVTAVNINTAGYQVLLALAGEHGESFVDYVVNNRPFASLEAFRGGAAGYFDLEPGEVNEFWPETLVGVSSDYFKLSVRVSLGTVMIEVNSLLSRRGREQPVVLQRSLRRVPEVETTGLNEEMSAALLSECQQLQRDQESEMRS